MSNSQKPHRFDRVNLEYDIGLLYGFKILKNSTNVAFLKL
jgi:hypothetical protein